VLEERKAHLGTTSNNVAEYKALLLGLEMARPYKPSHLAVYLDSELLVEQLNGRYRVKHRDLLPLYKEVLVLLGALGKVTFTHVPRGINIAADRLANQALDEAARPRSGGEPPNERAARRRERGRALPSPARGR
jgi:ribonuclease HI